MHSIEYHRAMQSGTILVCGGAGFIGSNFIRHILAAYPLVRVVCIDVLTYAGTKENLAGLPKDRLAFVQGDICDKAVLSRVIKRYKPVYAINFAAESHVDRSVHTGAALFARTNAEGVVVLLECLRQEAPQLKKFVQVSTDEVYGSLSLSAKKAFTENSPLSPRSPYAASKAAGDLLAHSFFETYRMPVVITRCSNNYGPYQHPEKFIPFSIVRLMEGKPVALYGDGKNVRDWIHVADHCRALVLALQKGIPGEVYNIGADTEVSNLALAKELLRFFGKKNPGLLFITDRPGHDRRYAIDASKIKKELGWKSKHTLNTSLPKTILWYQAQTGWLAHVRRKSALNPHI